MKIGTETTTCVRNVFKYDAAYKLARQVAGTAAATKEPFAPAKE